MAARIALVSCLFGLLLTGGAIVIGFYALAHQLDARSSVELLGKRDLLEHVLSEIPSQESISRNKHRFGDLLIGHDDLHLALADSSTGQSILSFSRIAEQSLPEPFPTWYEPEQRPVFPIRNEPEAVI